MIVSTPPSQYIFGPPLSLPQIHFSKPLYKKTWVSGLGLLQLNIGVNFWGRGCILITGNTCLMCWEDVCYVYVC